MRHLGLDTKGVCFLCLEKISSDDGDTSIPGWVTGFSLRSISCFLKIDQQSVLLKNLHNDKVSQSSSAYDFSVMLCQACYKISSKLASMITELEKLKILLDHQIITFHETLANSQKHGNILTVWEAKDVQKSLDELYERQMEMEVKLIDTLRQETKEKCRLFIESRSKKSPRVVVHRLEDQQTRKRKLVELQANNEQICSIAVVTKKTLTDLPIPVVVTQNISEEISERNVELKNKRFEDDDETQSKGQHACVPTSEIMKFKSTNIAQKLRHAIISNKNPIKVRQCLFCEVSFHCCSDTMDFNVHLHLSNVHPDKLFAREKSPQVLDVTFKEICLALLLSEVKNTPRLNRHLLPTLYSCLYCKHVVEKAQSIKCHYIKCHYNILSEKLTKLQNQNSTNHHQGAVIKYETTSTSSLTVSIHSMPTSPVETETLPISYLGPLPLSINEQSLVSTYPSSSVPLPSTQQNWQAQTVRVPIYPPISPQPPFNTMYNNGSRYNYSENGIIGHQAHRYETNHGVGKNNQTINNYYQNVANHDPHLYSSHSQRHVYESPVITKTGTYISPPQNAEIAHEHLTNNYSQKQMESSGGNDGVDNIYAEEPHSKSPKNLVDGFDPQSKNVGQSHVTCPYCKKIYNFEAIKLHIVQYHFDDIFTESRLPRIDLDQFKAMRKLFIQREVNMCTKTIPEDSRKIVTHCPYCTETFLDKLLLRDHLCHQHYYILREKFKKIQATHMGPSSGP